MIEGTIQGFGGSLINTRVIGREFAEGKSPEIIERI